MRLWQVTFIPREIQDDPESYAHTAFVMANDLPAAEKALANDLALNGRYPTDEWDHRTVPFDGNVIYLKDLT